MLFDDISVKDHLEAVFTIKYLENSYLRKILLLKVIGGEF